MNVATYTSKLGLVIILCLQLYIARTYLYFDGDPTTVRVVLDQKELCLHFIEFLETNGIALFPTLNTQWPVERISRV